ncbi:MAG: SufE family protein, partial [Microcystis sp. M53601_WE4]|nr:SufE family protein [Microcystis sp. M53601_WE4]
MLPSNLDRIVERLKRRTDPKQKYEQLLAFAKKLEPIPESAKIPAN